MGWLFTTYKDSLLPRELHTTTRSSQFSGAVAGEEEKTSARGVLRTHILYFVLLLCFTLFYFTCIAFYQKPKKIRILGSCYFFTLVYHDVP
jgi:hypothetical protein